LRVGQEAGLVQRYFCCKKRGYQRKLTARVNENEKVHKHNWVSDKKIWVSSGCNIVVHVSGNESHKDEIPIEMNPKPLRKVKIRK